MLSITLPFSPRRTRPSGHRIRGPDILKLRPSASLASTLTLHTAESARACAESVLRARPSSGLRTTSGTVLGTSSAISGSISGAEVLPTICLFSVRIGLSASRSLSANITGAVAVFVLGCVLPLSRLRLGILTEGTESARAQHKE
jgi:hypothetical protein